MVVGTAGAFRLAVFRTTFAYGKKATRPCPCGWLGAFAATGRDCRCTPDAVSRYQGRVSGPLMDRIDLQVEVPAVKPADLMGLPDGESSASVASRTHEARERQLARQGLSNGELEASQIADHCRLDDAAERFLHSAAERLGWSGRSVHRGLKVARTIADLAGAERITSPRRCNTGALCPPRNATSVTPPRCFLRASSFDRLHLHAILARLRDPRRLVPLAGSCAPRTDNQIQSGGTSCIRSRQPVP
jgi:hypothetical protein